MSGHAKRSPSGAAGWLACAGWQSDSKGSRFADEGTVAHDIAARCLSGNLPAAGFEGWDIAIDGAEPVKVSPEMVLAVQDYVDYVRDLAAATNGSLMVEQRLPISSITGEPEAHGTSDTVIVAADELTIVDLKYGRGVPVAADDNPQLQIYGLAALREFSLAQDFKTVRMVIHQPRLGAVSEFVQTVEELEQFAAHVALRIALHDKNPDARNPGEKQCRWCARKATCEALRSEVMDQFDNVAAAPATPVDALAGAMTKADLIEAWVKAIRAEVETRLLAGTAVPGFKLVQGKRGNRKWASEAEAEELLKAMRVKHDQMYDYSVISPTSAEKLAKAEVIGPRQWPKVQALITQAEGKPSVAPEADKRPALVLAAPADDFTDVSAASADDLT